jgi:ubiquinone/menaquinone biosynthesis C-methylase UbiE
MRRLAILATLLASQLAWQAPAQVAAEANTGYKTAEQRKTVAKTLSNPERDKTQRPGALIRDMDISAGMTVADVGTGIGYMLPLLSRAVGPAGTVIAEDIFDDFLEGARQLARNQNLTNITFVKGSETDPNLPEGKADRILVLDAYHHFDFPEKMLAALHKSLKTGGKLIVVEYYKRSEAMPNGRALTHIRLDMPEMIKEIEGNRFHLLMEREHSRNVQYVLVFDKN